MSELSRIAVIGRGRLGTALTEALRAAGRDVSGPGGRGETPPGADAIVLCVPDAEIPAAAAAVAGAAPFVGHTSGATPLTALAPAGAAGFGIHPLQTFSGSPHDAARFRGCRCAVGGTDTGALEVALDIARTLGMQPFELSDEQRPAYHAAASIASNFLVVLEAAAEEVAAGAGLDPAEARAALAPLVRATVENWAAHGPERALTGPVARGDALTVATQRAAVRTSAPQLEALFDVMVERAEVLAGQGVPA
jgi:predicted short-subunit dehydrogenase-like oxidoreductase (DUF2520 family)